MSETHELVLQPGLIVNHEFFDYFTMKESAKNWQYIAKYRFSTGGFYGCHRGVQLNDLQFAYSIRHEGIMIEGLTPKDCITIGLLQKNTGTVLVNGLKIEESDVIILDDSKPYVLTASKHNAFVLVSISKIRAALEFPWILDALDKIYKDADHALADTIDREWKGALSEEELLGNSQRIDQMENEIVSAIRSAFTGQTGKTPSLTSGEKTALEVKTFLLDGIEENTSIEEIVKLFKVSDKTLETSFKSLFGFTPKRFIDLLKLNKAHDDLSKEHTANFNVSDIANKWGFSHFGRFSKNYKALFGTLPSETLNLTPST